MSDLIGGAYFIIGLVVAGWALAHQKADDLEPSDLVIASLLFIVIVASLWPIVIGFAIAGYQKKARGKPLQRDSGT